MNSATGGSIVGKLAATLLVVETAAVVLLLRARTLVADGVGLVFVWPLPIAFGLDQRQGKTTTLHPDPGGRHGP